MWRKISCSRLELQLPFTLSGGQCFRWHKNDSDEWIGVFANKIWILKQADDCILYKTVHSSPLAKSESRTKVAPVKKNVQTNHEKTSSIEEERLLCEYFRLEIPLQKLYQDWSACDKNFENVSKTFLGVRILKQDLIENLFSFICSSNNNISRISTMVEKLCTLYGCHIATVGGTPYYSFPSVDALSEPSVEKSLRDAGFGYRARFLQQSASKIQSLGGHVWLQELKTKSYEEAKTALMSLPGIGAKVADCICLMSLEHLQAIPVDTHVWQISCRYLPHLKQYKSVTDKVYREIGDYFRGLYGSHAGWAHTVLFCGELKTFQNNSLPEKRKSKASDATKMPKNRKRKSN